jgi:epoxyqueuosine reductase
MEGAEPPTVEVLRQAGLAAGLDVVEVASAEPFVEVRRTLEARKAAGLHAGMAFTYRRPARSTTPGDSLPDARTLVVGARSYLTEEPAPEPGHGPVGRVARYAWEDHYGHLRSGLGAVAGVLKAAGWRARVLVDDNALVDRAAAQRAGLGWWGKNANLLLPGRGSWFVLGSVLTDAPLPPSAVPVDEACGTCARCLPACPTSAITEPGVVDARRCLSWLLQAEGPFPVEHRAALGDRIYGCDDCQDVCPPNRRATVRPASVDARAEVSLFALLDEDDAVVLEHAGRWYIPKRDPRYVRRNALVVLGNVGDGRDPATEAVLRRHLAHEDELLREHAEWAARALGREDLVPR